MKHARETLWLKAHKWTSWIFWRWICHVPFRYLWLPFHQEPCTSEFAVDLARLHLIKRTPGISGMLRVYNEEFLLRACVKTHIDFYDELVIVLDSSTTDSSAEIAEELQDKYPHKIKYHVYKPHAHKIRNWQFKAAPITDPCSFVNYYNYVLGKTRRQIVSKVDADHIAIPATMERAITRIRNAPLAEKEASCYLTYGIDLWLGENGEVFVDESNYLLGDGDHFFSHLNGTKGEHFVMARNVKYEHAGLLVEGRTLISNGILYFHLRNLRPNVFHEDHKTDAPFDSRKILRRYKKSYVHARQHALGWQEFARKHREALLAQTGTDIAALPDPNEYLRELGVLPMPREHLARWQGLVEGVSGTPKKFLPANDLAGLSKRTP